MTDEIQVFQFDGHDIEFKLSGRLMINATEMGRIFGKRPNDYLRLDRSKAVIAACLSQALQDSSERRNNGISRFIGVKSEIDLVKKTQKTGTWMNRIVAFDFAAWLDPRFAVWMYLTVDRLLRNPSVPEVSAENSAERKLLLDSIRRDEEALHAHQEQQKQLELYQATAEIQERLSKNRKRLKTLDREVVTQYNLFLTQQDADLTLPSHA